MRSILFSIPIFLLFSACSMKYDNVNLKDHSKKDSKIDKLALHIKASSEHINTKEAEDIAFNAISYSKHLANEYEVVKPALFHNTLINMNIKKRGYCYHYANDLMKYLNKKAYKSFDFKRVVSKRGEYFEHSAFIITRADISFENSIVLDAWRNSGDLYWSKIKDDKEYIWEIK